MSGAAIEQATLESPDGHRFDVTLYPAADKCRPLIVFFPALGTPGRVYARFAETLATHGISALTLDWRGMASSNWRAARRQDFGYRHLVELDGAAVLDHARRRLPDAPLWAGGHSLGGQLATLVAATHAGTSGVVAIASGSVYLPCYPPSLRAQIRLLGLVAEVAGLAVGHFPGRRLGFGGREARGVMRDWLQVARSGKYLLQGSAIDYESRLSHYGGRALAITLAADTWAPEAAARYLLTKMAAAHVDHWVWSAAHTGGLPLDHFSWLRHPEQVVPRVARWLLAQPARADSI